LAFPFMPMTDEMLKKLFRIIQDSNQTINSLDFPFVFVSQELKFPLELNPHRSETEQTDTSH